MSWSSAPSGATRARARSSTGCRSAPMWSCASRAATMPATRWSSTARCYKLSLLPSGIVRRGKLTVIGNGVVLDPWHLVAEIAKLRDAGRGDHAREPDDRRERAADPAAPPRAGPGPRRARTALAKIGTTGRGIGPAYEDKVGRRAIRVADLADAATLELQVDRPLAHHNALRAGLGLSADRPRRAAGAAARDRAADPRNTPPRSGRCSTKAARPASASCSRARRARCSTSTTAPIPSSPRPT